MFDTSHAARVIDFRGLGSASSSSHPCLGAGSSSSHPCPWGQRVLLTCEHATNTMPKPFQWHTQDVWLKDTHWAYDLGANDFMIDVARQLGTVGVGARFSRLLCDANRPIASQTLFRTIADGRPIFMNQEMTEDDAQWRLWKYYVPYHQKLGEVANALDPSLVISVHSFSPNYEGEKRPFELGVLCTHNEALANRIADQFQAGGFDVRVNEPWSGKDGFMFSADSVAISSPHSRKAMMLELRNDLAVDFGWRARVAGVLYKSLQSEMTTEAGDSLLTP